MYSCVLHGWNSYSEMCPICSAAATITTTSTTVNPVESPTTADASVLKDSLLELIKSLELQSWTTEGIIGEVKKALQLYSTQSPSSIEESGLKEGEEKTRRDIAKIMEDNIDFHPQVNGFVVHGAIDKIIQYFKKP